MIKDALVGALFGKIVHILDGGWNRFESSSSGIVIQIVTTYRLAGLRYASNQNDR